jgi:hypothetical protein
LYVVKLDKSKASSEYSTKANCVPFVPKLKFAEKANATFLA